MEAFQLYITDLAVPLVTSGGKESYNLSMGRWFLGPAARLPMAIAVSVCALAQSPPVHAWQDSIQLPTYPEGDPDPNPQFAIYGTDNPNYPYSMRNSPTRERPTVQSWRTLNLENEYLFCRILPDLGGHLYNCRDKRNGREVFYANPVVKKDLVGLRGAWVAMGIESNFPVAHTRDSVSPVDFADPNRAGRLRKRDRRGHRSGDGHGVARRIRAASGQLRP